MLFSVIIPTYHRNEDLAKCLECLASGQQCGGIIAGCDDPPDKNAPRAEDSAQASQSGEEASDPTGGSAHFHYEVIVSDDGRESTAKAMMAERFPWARWVQGPQRGPAANRNNGAKQAEGEWLVFTDDDCLPQAGWLETFFKNIHQAEVLEGKTIADRPRERLDEESPINETGGYLWCCNFAIKQSLFSSMKGFDESFPYAAMEDVEFRVRLEKSTQHLHFSEKALVVHPFRRMKGVSFLRKKHLSSQYLGELHPEVAPENLALKYVYVGLRGLLKETLPGIYRFRARGFIYSFSKNIFFLNLSLRYGAAEIFKPKKKNL